jgi:hypothetical protein
MLPESLSSLTQLPRNPETSPNADPGMTQAANNAAAIAQRRFETFQDMDGLPAAL